MSSLDRVLPAYTLDQIADYLTTGFWEDMSHPAGTVPVDSSGVITVNIKSLDAYGQEIAIRALDAWEAVSGLTFELGTGWRDMNFKNDESGAFAQTWITSKGNILLSQINISTDWLQYGEDYYFQTYMHEIGHALGLGHTGNYNFSANYAQDAHFSNDSWQVSVMSYFHQNQNTSSTASFAYAATLQLADILAIQNLYGIPVDVEAGDTTYGDNTTTSQYGMDLSGEYAVALFDSGGIDTINLSSHNTDTNLTLVAEEYSDIGGKIGNFAIARHTVIENATLGAGDDILLGNHVDNILSGGAGTDTLDGGAGNDTLAASGEDVLTGGTGADLFVFSGDSDATITDFSSHAGDLIDLSWYFENALSYFGSDVTYADLWMETSNLGVELGFNLDDAERRLVTLADANITDLNFGTVVAGYEVVLADEVIVPEGNQGVDLLSPLGTGGAGLELAIVSGADADLFEVDETGLLKFIDEPDFETAVDQGGDNTYDLMISLFDGRSTSVQKLSVIVANVNEAAVFTSEAQFELAENTSEVGQITAIDEDGDALSFDITGGADAALFEIDDNGRIAFSDAPDYETAMDLDGDNTYELQVSVNDGLLSTTQHIEIVVEDVLERVVLSGSNSGDYLVGADADEVIHTNGGAIDMVTGGGGADEFHITDTAGRDIVRIFDYDASEGDVINIGDNEIALTRAIGSFTYIFLADPDSDILILDGISDPESELVFV